MIRSQGYKIKYTHTDEGTYITLLKHTSYRYKVILLIGRNEISF